MRSPMIVRWISEVPPAMLPAFDHSHCRCHLPQIGDAGSTTSRASSDRCWLRSVYASFTQLDSGPGS